MKIDKHTIFQIGDSIELSNDCRFLENYEKRFNGETKGIITQIDFSTQYQKCPYCNSPLPSFASISNDLEDGGIWLCLLNKNENITKLKQNDIMKPKQRKIFIDKSTPTVSDLSQKEINELLHYLQNGKK